MLTMGVDVFTKFNAPSIKIDMAVHFMLVTELVMFWTTLDARSNPENELAPAHCLVGCSQHLRGDLGFLFGDCCQFFSFRNFAS